MIDAAPHPGTPARVLFWRSLAAVLALAFALLLGAPEAHAHATLTGTEPVGGVVMSAPPERVTLQFNEPVSLLAAILVVPGGETLALDDFSQAASAVSIALPAGLGQGSHALSWRAVSEDGHPISGTTFFVIGAASATPPMEATQQDSLVVGLLWSTRLVLYVAIFFGVGGAAFRILAELPAPAKSIARWTSIAGLIVTPIILGLQGVDLLGGGLAELTSLSAWSLGLNSPYGATLGLAFVALLGGLTALSVSSRLTGRLAATIAIVLTGLAISASGHASVADPKWLTRAALFIHVTTIAWWVGALTPLILLLRQDHRIAAPALIRFSPAIPFAIVPLIISGATLAIVQLGPPGPAWLAPYGQVLAAKLGLLVVLFAIASWNRWVLTAPAARGDDRALKDMRRGIASEIVIILVVLGLVSIWRFTPPPRALADTSAAPLTIELSNDRLWAQVSFSSSHVGDTDVEIALQDGAGAAISPRSIRLLLQPENEIMAPIARAADPGKDGIWRVENLNLPMGGPWVVEVEVRVGDFELTKIGGTVTIE